MLELPTLPRHMFLDSRERQTSLAGPTWQWEGKLQLFCVLDSGASSSSWAETKGG